MLKKISFCLLLLLAYSNNAFATTVKINIFSEVLVQEFEFLAFEGNYKVIADGNEVLLLKPKEKISLKRDGSSIKIVQHNGLIASAKDVKIQRADWKTTFKLTPKNPLKSARVYGDNLLISIRKNALLLLNQVDVEKYIDGVIEAESGSKQNLEYYKVQAIISRTYALNQIQKHAHQGYNLCDQVHCQVYKGRSNSSALIPEGVKQTTGMVVVDADLKLISTVFHANCGGKTVNSENVWTYPLPYLKAKKDTFCLGGVQANWEKVINKKEWLSYLEKKHKYPVNDTLYYQEAISHIPLGRELYFGNIISQIPLKIIRADWGFRSTWFTIKENPANTEELIISGKGFGHGVGLCQEGAMGMSRFNYSFVEILQHYFTDIHIIDLSVLSHLK